MVCAWSAAKRSAASVQSSLVHATQLPHVLSTNQYVTNITSHLQSLVSINQLGLSCVTSASNPHWRGSMGVIRTHGISLSPRMATRLGRSRPSSRTRSGTAWTYQVCIYNYVCSKVIVLYIVRTVCLILLLLHYTIIPLVHHLTNIYIIYTSYIHIHLIHTHSIHHLPLGQRSTLHQSKP